MSHIATVQLVVKDLDSLKKAATELGLEFVEGQNSFKWFGYKNSPCEHVLRVPNNPGAYEVGVVKNANGEGYALNYDNWNGGYGLETLIGHGAQKLKQAYGVEVARKQVARMGLRVQQTRGQDGKVRLVCSR